MIVQVLGVAAAVWLFVATWQVWILGFVALIIAAAILPAARAGERWHVPRGLVVLGNPMRLTTGVVGAVFELLAVLVIAAYLVIDTREIGHTLLALLPREHRATATRLAPAVLNRIGGYVRGQIVSSFFVGVLIAVALALLGVKYALLIGALAAVLNVVPFVGATIATVLATLSALNDGVVRAGITLPVMVLCQTIEGKLLAPYFVGRATGLHALAVLVALLAGFQLGGLVGGLVAVPFLAGAWEVVRTLWVEPRRS